jgi:hypothetical protein
LPIITWGGDIATILANGSAKNTAAGSIFDSQGLKFTLKREDDFTGKSGITCGAIRPICDAPLGC